MFRQRCAALITVLSIFFAQAACGGRSNGGSASNRPRPHFKPGFNLFSPDQDVELGKQSAQQIASQVPILNDAEIVGYVRRIGSRLADKAPGYEFPYQFNVVATRDVNAFALPGGFIFVNAGVIAAAKNEGELAGVMAHEVCHVALRHGTNQASKAYIAKAGLGILGSIAGGQDTEVGQVINVLGGAGANAAFLKMGRTAETQADLEGARIMAEAGYDPRDMAEFFKTLQAQDGRRIPEFLSDHPDPGNRIAAINEVIPSLPVSPNPTRTTDDFNRVKARLTGQGALGSSREPARIGPRDPNDNEPASRPDPPSPSFRPFESRDSTFVLEYPDNWDALVADDSNMIFAPKGAYGEAEQSVVVTHGVFVGAVSPEASDLENATARFVQQQVNSNPDFRIARRPERIDFGGRPGYATVVAGPSPITGVVEVDVIYTTSAGDGRLFYFITIAPEDEYERYKATFERIINSIRLAK